MSANTPLLCIDTRLMRVRRYITSPHGRPWITNEVMIEGGVDDGILSGLRTLLLAPKQMFPQDHIPPGAA